jgi:hypothetical protein
MFYAPVNPHSLLRGVVYRLRLPFYFKEAT